MGKREAGDDDGSHSKLHASSSDENTARYSEKNRALEASHRVPREARNSVRLHGLIVSSHREKAIGDGWRLSS